MIYKMTAIELKNVLMHRIAEINDVSFLQAIKTILDSKTEAKALTLTLEQRDEIMASKKEIEKGLFISHEELDKEVSEWLSAK
jgi:predicted transcriptional regulator